MFYKFAVQRFFNIIKDDSGFNFLEFPDLGNKSYFYNMSFSFEDKAYKRLSQFVYEDRGEPFIFAMYNRGNLSAVPTQPRQFKASHRNIAAASADLYTVKNVQAQTNICWISNDPSYLMEFEEYLLLGYDRTKSYTATYQIPTDYLNLGNITAIDQPNKKLTIIGEFSLVSGNSILISNSTGNDGAYDVVSSSIVSGNTEIVVSQNVLSSISDGLAIKQNALMEMDSTIFLKDIESNSFSNFNDQSRGELTYLVTSFNMEYPVIKKETSGAGKLIKHISLKVKVQPDMTTLDMIQPYDEINIPS